LHLSSPQMAPLLGRNQPRRATVQERPANVLPL
jgi:hypothetical protein